MKHKEYVCGFFACLLWPLGIWAGIELDKNNWLLAIAIISGCMVMEFANILLWFQINKEIHVKNE